MIDMSVRDQDGITAINARAQTLLAVIGRNIDQDHAGLARCVGELQHGACAQTLVTRVGALARGAGATNHGHARTCSSSKQCERGVQCVHKSSRSEMCCERTVIWTAPNNFVKTKSCGIPKFFGHCKVMLQCAQKFWATEFRASERPRPQDCLRHTPRHLRPRRGNPQRSVVQCFAQ